MKVCPFCKTEIDDDAQKCKNCGEWVNKELKQREFGKTLAFAFFFGFLGVHRFYTGYKKIGIAQLILSITIIGFMVSMIWSFIDIISICLNKYRDVQNRELLNYNKTAGIIVMIIAIILFLYNLSNGIEGWNNTETSGDKPIQTPKADSSTKKDNSIYIGDDVKVGYISYHVYGTNWQSYIGDKYFGSKANASYLIVDISAKNEDKQSRLIPNFELIDDDGNKYESSEDAMYLGDKAFIFESLNPSVSKRGYVVFDVPKKDTYKLVISGGYFSGDNTNIVLNEKPFEGLDDENYNVKTVNIDGEIIEYDDTVHKSNEKEIRETAAWCKAHNLNGSADLQQCIGIKLEWF